MTSSTQNRDAKRGDFIDGSRGNSNPGKARTTREKRQSADSENALDSIHIASYTKTKVVQSSDSESEVPTRRVTRKHSSSESQTGLPTGRVTRSTRKAVRKKQPARTCNKKRTASKKSTWETSKSRKRKRHQGSASSSSEFELSSQEEQVEELTGSEESQVDKVFVTRLRKRKGSESEFELSSKGGNSSEEEISGRLNKDNALRVRQPERMQRFGSESSSSSGGNSNEEENDNLSGSGDEDGGRELLTREQWKVARAAKRENLLQASRCLNVPTHKCVGLDAISCEELPKVHFTYQYKQGSVSYCYKLETLRDIALTKRRWLEPPTFLEPMIESTKAAICKVFGLDDLVLDDMNDNRYEGDATEGKRLLEKLSGQQVRCMQDGGDLYVCPICYEMSKEEMHHEEDELVDPIDVLTHNGLDYVGAACMCFETMADLKNHLLFAHDTKMKRSEETSSFLRSYRIRGTDGLVQHYAYQQGDVGYAYCKRYWQRRANNYMHVYSIVLSLGSGSKLDTAFSVTRLRKDSARIWQDLTDTGDDIPFIKSDQEVSGEDSDASGIAPVLLDNDEREELESLQMRFSQSQKLMDEAGEGDLDISKPEPLVGDSSCSDSSGSESGDSSIRFKEKGKEKKKHFSKASTPKKSSKRVIDSSDEDGEFEVCVQRQSQSKRVIDSSDEECEFLGSVNSKRGDKQVESKRKRVIDSSDEECEFVGSVKRADEQVESLCKRDNDSRDEAVYSKASPSSQSKRKRVIDSSDDE